MPPSETAQFIYVVGEQQTATLQEKTDILSFTREHMQQIDTAELVLVIANVFGKGQLFPGPDEALNAVIHEYVQRAEVYQTYQNNLHRTKTGRCTVITAFKRLDGEIAVQVAAVVPVTEGSMSIDNPERFHTLLLNSLPGFQHAFTSEAYAADSRMVAIIKEATLYHINKKLN